MPSVADNLKRVREELATAALAAGRAPETVQLVAVSKMQPLQYVQELFEAGQHLLAENRVQDLVQRHEHLPQARWHLIGSLQRNKVKYVAGFVELVHSVDSAELMVEIDKRAQASGRVQPVLLQVNISGEDQKHGCPPDRVEPLLEAAAALAHVQLQGLMGMAELTTDRMRIARQFALLRQLSEKFRGALPPPHHLNALSMGMSQDYDLAIAEGATLVRVGSALFAGLPPLA